MKQLEHLREKLYQLMESGDTDSILKTSKELDRLILFYMKEQDSIQKKQPKTKLKLVGANPL